MERTRETTRSYGKMKKRRDKKVTICSLSLRPLAVGETQRRTTSRGFSAADYLRIGPMYSRATTTSSNQTDWLSFQYCFVGSPES